MGGVGSFFYCPDVRSEGEVDIPRDAQDFRDLVQWDESVLNFHLTIVTGLVSVRSEECDTELLGGDGELLPARPARYGSHEFDGLG